MRPNSEFKQAANFLFEVGMLAKTPRSGFFFLGSGNQTVAEHINRTVYIGFVLSRLVKDVDAAKVMQMCVFHDIAEARVSDLNYVHQKYTVRHEHKAVDDLAASVPFGEELKMIIDEYETRETREAQLAKDADNLEFLISIKEQSDIGNSKAKAWMPSIVKRLQFEESKELAEAIITADSDDWWFGDRDDEWWVNRTTNK